MNSALLSEILQHHRHYNQLWIFVGRRAVECPKTAREDGKYAIMFQATTEDTIKDLRACFGKQFGKQFDQEVMDLKERQFIFYERGSRDKPYKKTKAPALDDDFKIKIH